MRSARRAPASRAPPAARDRPSRPSALPARDRSRPRGPRSVPARRGPMGSSRRDLRPRSMSRHTRATTVVSHPPRLPISPASERASRSQASCTASSASRQRPEHPVGDPPQVVAIALELFRQKFLFDHRSHSFVSFRHSHDERNPAGVTTRSARELCRQGRNPDVPGPVPPIHPYADEREQPCKQE